MGDQESDRMRLLFITRDFSKYVERNPYYLINALSSICDLAVWYEDGDIHEILLQLPFLPDFILLNDLRERHCPEISGLPTLNIPFGIIMHDLHDLVEARKAYILHNNVRHIFSIYRDAFYRQYPEFADRFHWFPHFAEMSIFQDYELNRDIDYLLMGCVVPSYYPLRQAYLKAMSHLPGFVYHEHPGYRDFEESEKQAVYTSESYAREISRAKMFLTCGTIYGYPIRKYFEVLGCKTLLLAPSSTELSDLGFRAGTHYIAVTENDFLSKAQYYLNHEEERLRIAAQGYEMVRSRHSAEQRAVELVAAIENILVKGYANDIVGNCSHSERGNIPSPVFRKRIFIRN